jgi:two-component system NtrC family sensor kinase
VKAPALAEAAVDLPWLAPCAGSLAALVRLPAAQAWVATRGDPGLVLLWARCADPTSVPTFAPHSLQHPRILDRALRHLDQPAFVDWTRPDLFPIYRTCHSQATLAQLLASHVENCNPDCAWITALLAPLGWLAACAVDPNAVNVCREHADFARAPASVQQRCWGLDHTAIARRLCRRWALPSWLTAVVSQLGLPAGIAQTLGADSRLLQVVQLAVGLFQQEQDGLGLVTGSMPAHLIEALALSRETVEECLRAARGFAQTALPISPWSPPSSTPLLGDYLRLARAQGGRADFEVMERLQAELDQLHHALEEQCAGETERLRELKLRALAELAAGAGHEINNPLAVISGQAQYLMGHEADPARCKALQAIIAQTRRIHQILTDLMQFARPAPPQKELVEVGDLLRDTVEALRPHAEQAHVQLISPEPSSLSGRLYVDPAQIRAVLGSLLRNALEAAPADGQVRLHVQGEASAVEMLVEDNGPGPSASVQEHMFDPFFSGKSAGRGRGLGLTTAWRLAQLNGGQVRFDGHIQGLTHFVLRLPLLEAASETEIHTTAPLNGQLAVAAHA